MRCHMLAAWCCVPRELSILASRTLCNSDQKAFSDVVNEEFDIDSDDDMDLEICGEASSQEWSPEKCKSESESEISSMSTDGWKWQ